MTPTKVADPATYEDLRHKRALVTGANSGIGLATASRLLESGCHLVASDLYEGDGLHRLSAAGAEIVKADISSSTDRGRLTSQAGSVDFLVNSAGIMKLRPVAEMDEEMWDQVMSVNAKGTFFVTKEVGLSMNDGGAIVNLSSMAARRAVNVETAVYAASKAAVASMTRSFSHAFALRDIRVNAVLPGLIDTPMQRQVVRDTAAARGADAEELGQSRMSDIPLGRLGLAEDVAETILWLLSSASSFITGQSVAIDGGLTMY